ncbi:hypothetical protein FS837_010499 [Tulasnella sp. UAMH 9824]|nr:hypothetical protein FS837_010499 [Tulasnella sp. UAMH 9824]
MTAEKEETVIGYYRYTDIMFEWHKTCPEDSVEQLKAFMYPGCLTSPENPLVAGGEGLQIWQATMRANNEIRLLYSSAQIEYIRYWLYEMGITPQKIPIPRSQYIIPEDQLMNITPRIFKSDSELKKAQKDLVKTNKRLKGVDSGMQAMRETFEKVRKLYQTPEKTATWCAIDLEDWEYDHKIITEFGYSLVQWDGQEEKRERGHWTVAGTPHNGVYVPDARDYYHYGDTVQLSKTDFIARINAFLSGLAERGPLFLVFHDPTSDVKDLNLLHISVIKDMRYTLPDPVPTPGVYCIDTRKVFSALEGVKEPKSLSRICRILGLRDFYHFHNAGNDAEYTLQCLISMASGAPIDAQREARWPTRPGDLPPNVKREYARESRPEDESDWEDPSHPF